MATTTMNSPDARRATNQTIYWVVGAVLVIALALFFALRPNPTTDVLPTTVERSAPAPMNAVPPTTSDVAPANPANPPAGTVPGTTPADNRY